MRNYGHLICELADHWEIPHAWAQVINKRILRLASKENKVSVKAMSDAFNILSSEDFNSFIDELKNVLDKYWKEGKKESPIIRYPSWLDQEEDRYRDTTTRMEDFQEIWWDRDYAKRIVNYYIKELIRIGACCLWD